MKSQESDTKVAGGQEPVDPIPSSQIIVYVSSFTMHMHC